jgi:endonuclease-3
MSAKNRTDVIAKSHKVLKKHYTPVAPPSDRTVLEHVVYACCLEDAPFDKADDAYKLLLATYFDWNEVRVTTVTELAEALGPLPNTAVAARNLKHTLQCIFEAYYSYDLEALKKQNLGKAVAELEQHCPNSPFVTSYLAQNALGGHSIACDRSTFDLFILLDLLTPSEAKKGKVPGLERAIAKTKGVEYFSLLHQLAVDLAQSPGSKKVRDIVLEIDSSAKDRFPKRSGGKEEAAQEQASGKKYTKKQTPAKAAAAKKKSAPKKTPAKQPAAKKAPAKKAPAKRVAKKKTDSKSIAKKKPR